MLKRSRLAKIGGLCALCVLTLDAGAAPPGRSGPPLGEPAFELAQSPRPRRDGIPGIHPCQPQCREACYRRAHVCIFAARKSPTPRSARWSCNSRLRHCQAGCDSRCVPPGGPPLYPPPGLRR
jgi:hypothetical protein